MPEPSENAGPAERPRAARWLVQALRVVAIAALGWAAAIAFGQSSHGKSWELATYNKLFEYRFPGGLPPPPEDVVVIGIDDTSLGEIGKQWPLPRSLHAQVIDRLSAAGAKAIVVDVLFSEPSNLGPEDDEALAAAVRRAGNVVLASTIQRLPARAGSLALEIETRVDPLPILAGAAAAVGLAQLPIDPDGFVRRGWALLPGEAPGGGRETLAGAALRLVSPAAELPEGDLWVNFRGPPGLGIRRVSYYQVLEGSEPRDFFRGRVVFLGRVLSAAAELTEADSFLVPYFKGARSRMAGVEIQANLFSSLARGDSIRPAPAGASGMIVAAEVLVAALLFLVFRPAPAFAGAAILAMLHGAAAWRLFAHGLWIPAIVPPIGVFATLAADTVADYMTVEKDRRKVRRAFSRYLDPSVLREVLRNPKMLLLGGEEVVGTVLFTDLQGFTSMAEKMRPSDLVNFLNEYFTEMLNVVRRHRGTFDKFIGDAIMAFWGIPVRDKRHATDACRAALEMQSRLEKLNAGWKTRGLPDLAMRVGIATGRVVAGNMGSRELFDYTVMGDTVNLASRLEGTNKIYGSRILVSEATRKALDPAIVVRELDLVAVKGKEEPRRVFEILGEASQTGEATKRLIEVFAAGVAAYRARRWDEALRHFREALGIRPEDPPSLLYVDRCEAFRSQPPPPDWTGVYRMDTK